MMGMHEPANRRAAKPVVNELRLLIYQAVGTGASQ